MRLLTLSLFFLLLVVVVVPVAEGQPAQPRLLLKSPVVHRYMTDAAIVFTWLEHEHIDQPAGWVLSCDNFHGRVVKSIPFAWTEASFVYWPLSHVKEAWIIAGYASQPIPACDQLPILSDSVYFDFSSFMVTGDPGITPDDFMVRVDQVNPRLAIVEAWLEARDTPLWVRTCATARPFSGSRIYHRPPADQELLPGDRPDLLFAYYPSTEVVDVWVAAGKVGTARPPCNMIEDYDGAVRVTFPNRVTRIDWGLMVQ